MSSEETDALYFCIWAGIIVAAEVVAIGIAVFTEIECALREAKRRSSTPRKR